MTTHATDAHALGTLQERLRHARELGEVQPAEMDRLAGFGWRGHYALIEAGVHKSPTGATLAKIAAALGVSTDWLLSGSGRAPAKSAIERAVRNARARAEARRAKAKAPPPEAA
jgi:transcriptional regulator with XRE-family HTH domain